MTYNLFHLTYRVARALGDVIEGTATAGAATNITDTVDLLNVYPDDWFNNGSAWILYDAGGAGASPEGKFARVTDFVKATGVATIVTVTDAVAAGDRYGIATAKFPLSQLIAKINEALDETPIKVVDVTTLTTAGSTTEYTLPAAVLEQSINVWIQGQDVTGDNHWIEWNDWYIQETGIGTQKKLVFRTQPPYPYDLKLEYIIPHPALNIYTDKLDEQVNINRIVFDAAYRCLLWKKDQMGDTDPDLDRRIDNMEGRLERARWRHPATQTGEVKLATLGFIDNEAEDEV